MKTGLTGDYGISSQVRRRWRSSRAASWGKAPGHDLGRIGVAIGLAVSLLLTGCSDESTATDDDQSKGTSGEEFDDPTEFCASFEREADCDGAEPRIDTSQSHPVVCRWALGFTVSSGTCGIEKLQGKCVPSQLGNTDTCTAYPSCDDETEGMLAGLTIHIDHSAPSGFLAVQIHCNWSLEGQPRQCTYPPSPEETSEAQLEACECACSLGSQVASAWPAE
jgi:hypothetical protein